MSRLTRWLSPLALFVVVAALLGYMAYGVSRVQVDSVSPVHFYEYLAQGFLKGQTNLSVDPDPYLATVPNPYVPAASEGHRVSDLSYYHGKYYLYFGPAPVVLFLLPAKLLTGNLPPQWLCAPFFGAVGFLFLALAAIEIRNAHFPKLSRLRLALVMVALLHATWLPVMMGRASVWEIAILAEVACFWGALYGLWRYARTGRVRWAAFSTAMVVAATASRPTILPASGALLVALAWCRPSGGRARWRGWIAPALVLGAGGLILATYNYARFGNPLNFGNKLQLLAEYIQGKGYFTFSTFRYNAAIYLFQPPIFSPYFPYVFGARPIPPSGFFGIDEIHGALIAVPILLVALLGLRFGWAMRKQTAFIPLTVVLASTVFAALVLDLTLFVFPGICIRYTCELLAGWVPAIGVGGLVLLDPDTAIAPALRASLRTLAGLLTLWTVGYVWLAAVSCYDISFGSTPGRFRNWAHVLGGPSGWVGKAGHLRYGPVFLDVALDPYTGPRDDVLMKGAERYIHQDFRIRRIDATHVQFEFGCSIGEGYGSILTSPVVECSDNHLQVVATAPWLYPPAENPYWDRFPAHEAFLRGRDYEIRVGNRIVTFHSPNKSQSVQLQPDYARSKGPSNPDAWVSDIHWALPGL